jgi:ferredoxin-NADP reductase
MIALAATSTDSAVRRLGAKRWKKLHRLVYVVGALGCIHYFMLVKADVRKPLVFAGVVTLLLAYRGLASLRRRNTAVDRPWSGKLRILSARQETKDVRTLRLVNPAGGPLPFTFAPGQYLNVSFELDGKAVRRSYTIASSTEQRAHCEITVRRTDDGWVSRHVHEGLSEGDLIAITAPAGRFVFDPIIEERVTLIGGGVGITPLMSIVRSMTDRAWRGRMEMILSMRSAEEIIFAEELLGLAKRFPNLHVTITLTRGAASPHRQGRLDKEALTEILGGAPAGPIYLCGPEAMMREVRATLLSLGVSEPSIRTEAFVSPKASSASATDGDAQEIAFEQQGIVTSAPRGLTILEAAENAGLTLPFECRSGICGQCKVKLLRGEVTMDSEDALSPAEKADGLVLACQAHATSDVIVDA